MNPLTACRTVSALVVGLFFCVSSCGRGIRPDAARTPQIDSAISDSAFAGLSSALSEDGGFFDTDNLISNETAYLQVIGDLRSQSVNGGAYLGVGPGQNFSYIAAIRPRVAFIIDIRRDNLLQHLLYKAIFEAAPTRVEFLGLLVGRDVSAALEESLGWSIDELVRFVDASGRTPPSSTDAMGIVRNGAGGTGIAVTELDLATIERFHRTFIDAGLDLRFNSFGRAPQPYYPTLRQLLTEVDLNGDKRNYLASEEGYQFLRGMQQRNLIIPVVGNLAGEHALRAIGEWVEAAGLTVSAFYTSNVEFYLWQDGTFRSFAENVRSLPRSRSSVIVRSYFGGGFRRRPGFLMGYANSQLVQPMGEFVEDWQEGRYRTYLDLVFR